MNTVLRLARASPSNALELAWFQVIDRSLTGPRAEGHIDNNLSRQLSSHESDLTPPPWSSRPKPTTLVEQRVGLRCGAISYNKSCRYRLFSFERSFRRQSFFRIFRVVVRVFKASLYWQLALVLNPINGNSSSSAQRIYYIGFFHSNILNDCNFQCHVFTLELSAAKN